MSPKLVDINATSLTYLCLGGFTSAFSIASIMIRDKLYVNEVVLGTIFGVIVGPFCLNIFDPRSWSNSPTASNVITLEVTRIALAIGLFAIGVELPRNFLWKHKKGLLVMVVPTMAVGWIIVSGLTHVLFGQLSLISCLAISACLTPTDPVVAAAVVDGKFANDNVPLDLRRLILAESASNDGLAYPFLSIALYLLLDDTIGEAFEHMAVLGFLYQVLLGTTAGAVLGLIFSRLMSFSQSRGFVDRQSYVAQYISLTFLTIGIATLIGLDDLLAAFAAGSAISWDGKFNDHVEDEIFAKVIDLVLNCACFVYIGAWLPFDMFHNADLGIHIWQLVVLLFGILALRRVPVILMLYKVVPEITNWKEALFAGHFGPMGVGAVFISTLAISRLPEPHSPPESQAELLATLLQPIVAFVVLGSIVIHGLSVPFFNVSRTMTSTASTPIAIPEWLLHIQDGQKAAGPGIRDLSANDRSTPAFEAGVTPNTGNALMDQALEDGIAHEVHEGRRTPTGAPLMRRHTITGSTSRTKLDIGW